MQRRAEAEGEASCRAATTQMDPVSPFLPHSAMWIFAGSVNWSFFAIKCLHSVSVSMCSIYNVPER